MESEENIKLGNTLVREFGLEPAFHEEFSELFKDNCTFLKIGSGFSTDQLANPTERNVGKPRDGASTVVLAEPRKETGLRCFAAMPFRERDAVHSKGFFDEVLRALIAPAGREAGFEVLTANRDGSDVIQATIVNQLLDADLVIADLTENNPNVLFELGLRIHSNTSAEGARASTSRDCPRTMAIKAASDSLRDAGAIGVRVRSGVPSGIRGQSRISPKGDLCGSPCVWLRVRPNPGSCRALFESRVRKLFRLRFR